MTVPSTGAWIGRSPDHARPAPSARLWVAVAVALPPSLALWWVIGRAVVAAWRWL